MTTFIALELAEGDAAPALVTVEDDCRADPGDVLRRLTEVERGQGRKTPERYSGRQLGRAIGEHLPAYLHEHLVEEPDALEARFMLEVFRGVVDSLLVQVAESSGAPAILAGIEGD
jgi:hypothetical protein